MASSKTQHINRNVVLLQLKADDRPPHVVTVLLQELSSNNENDWVEHLVGEMVEGAGQLSKSPDAIRILKESLALTCLSEDFVKDQLQVRAVASAGLCLLGSVLIHLSALTAICCARCGESGSCLA